MPTYFSAPRIALAIDRLAESRAKIALFDFLLVKRTFVLKNATSVAITEKETSYVKALAEFGACGEYKGRQVKPDEKFYLNPFATQEKGRQGYRKKRYRSNGTNSTIRGTTWKAVFSLTGDKPQKASLVPDYLGHLESLLLKAGKETDKPNLTEVAVWYFRQQDLDPIIGTATEPEASMTALTKAFRERFGLTDDEIAKLFSTGGQDAGN